MEEACDFIAEYRQKQAMEKIIAAADKEKAVKNEKSVEDSEKIVITLMVLLTLLLVFFSLSQGWH